jgi:PAS domain S-box-containing protein
VFCRSQRRLNPKQAKSKNVLVLFSSSAPDNAQFLDVIEPAIRAHVSEPITFYIADLIINVGQWGDYQESQAEVFRHTYANVKLDLVIPVDPPAALFAVQYRDRGFPGVPIVFTQIGTREFGERTWPTGVTGLTVPVGVGETIDLALRLHPDTKNVAVLPGQDVFWTAVAHAEMLRRQDRVKEIQLLGPPTPELLAQALALPPHTVVLFHNSPGLAHAAFGGWDLLAGITQRWPTYSAWPAYCLNHRCIGGAYPDRQEEDARTADIAARVLNGERPENIPVTHDSNLQIRVDWRELQRWHIPESALTPGSVVLYRPPTLWEQYRRYAIAVMVVISALLLLIAWLLWERARKRKAEALLRESEKRFRVMAESTPSLVWMCDGQGKITYLNERRLTFTGPAPNAGYGDSWMEYVHPDDRRNVQDVVSQALKDRRAFSHEYRLRRDDGVYRWMFDVASPRLNGDGSFAGFIGSAIDVTDQKVAQQALEKVSGQLIEAQENERRRIARDLHDDICQRLALLSMELDQANRGVNESADVTKHRLKEIREHCSEIAGDVQSLSHELHSSRLDYLGIVAQFVDSVTNSRSSMTWPLNSETGMCRRRRSS